MTEINTNNYYPPQVPRMPLKPSNPSMGSIPATGATSARNINPAMSGGPAGITLEDARRHATQNTLGKAAEKTSGNPLTTLLYGYLAALGSTKAINWLLLNNSDYDQTRFKWIVDKLDASEADGKLKTFKGLIRDKTPIGKLRRGFNDLSVVQYIKKNCGKLKPKNSMGYGAYRPLDGDLLEELTDKSQRILSGDKARKFAGEFVETNGKKGFFSKVTLKKSATLENVLKEFGITGAPDLANKEFLKKLPGGAADEIKKHLNALQKGKVKAAQKTLGNIIGIIGKAHGDKHTEELRTFLEKLRNGTINSTNDGLKQLGTLLKDTDIPKEKFFTGYVNDIKSIMRTPNALKNNKFFSATAQNCLRGFKRFCRLPLMNGKMSLLFVGMTAFFVGDAIKRTIDAPKEDKLSTFMESTVGEVLPFWVLYSPMIRKFYDTAEILKKIPVKSFNGIKGVAARTGKFLGNLMSVGLGNGEATGKFIERINGLKNIPLKNKGLLAKIGRGTGTLLSKNVATNTIKGLAKLGGSLGGAGRFLFFMFALQPFVGEIFKKGTHAIFGKPQRTIKEEQEIKAENAAEKVEKEAAKQNHKYTPLPVNQNEKTSPLVAKYMNTIRGGRTEVPHPTTQIASANPVLNQAPALQNTPNIYSDDVEPLAGAQYTFSEPTPVKQDPKQQAEFDSALASVDNAILRAERLFGTPNNNV